MINQRGLPVRLFYSDTALDFFSFFFKMGRYFLRFSMKVHKKAGIYERIDTRVYNKKQKSAARI